jgi:hypothetical protein
VLCYLGTVRTATLVLVLLAACNDLREFAGEWRGARVGTSEVVRVGVSDGATATLVVEEVDSYGLRGRLTVGNEGSTPLVDDVPFSSLPGAEADALATMSFTGAPLRVYLAFVPISDGRGDALAVIGLYDSRRMDVRLLRGGTAPIYAIFALSEPSP